MSTLHCRACDVRWSDDTGERACFMCGQEGRAASWLHVPQVCIAPEPLSGDERREPNARVRGIEASPGKYVTASPEAVEECLAVVVNPPRRLLDRLLRRRTA